MATILSNINLFVRDVEQAQQFYVDVLGLTVDKDRSASPSFALLRAGQVTITLQDAATPGAAFGESQSLEVGFAVDDVEKVRAKLVERGMEVGEVQSMGWGDALDFKDEDGHRLTALKMREGS